MADLQNSLLDRPDTKRPRIKTEDNDDSSDMATTQNAISQSIQNLYANNRLADITLVVAGTSYPSHRFLLCVFSNVFKNMLMNTNNNEPNQVVELHEILQSCIDVFPLFLKFFYTGDILLKKSIIMPVLLLAEKYEVEDLKVICVEFMYKHIVDAADQGQLVLWFQYVLSLNQPSAVDDSYYCKIWQNTEDVGIKSPWNKLFEACRNYIKWNLHSCINCFDSFERDILVGLLKQTDLIVQDEVQLFGFVTSWLNCQSDKKLLECYNADMVKDYMTSLIEDVMSYIRYPMILPRQMAELLMVPIIKQNTAFFVNKMAAAMVYHTVKMEKQSSTKYVMECTPRLYTSKDWGKSFRTVYQLIKQKFETCSCPFEKADEEREILQWELKFGKRYIGASVEGSQVLTKTMQVKIKPKFQPEEGKFLRHVRVAILLYAFQNGIPYVVTVMQNTMLFDTNNTYISGPIIYNAVNGPIKDVVLRHRIPFKLHVIIVPAISGVMDAHSGNIIEHVFYHSKT